MAFFINFAQDMNYLRFLILFLSLLPRLNLVAHDTCATPVGSLEWQIRDENEKNHDWENRETRMPLATLHESSPAGAINMRQQRTTSGSSHFTSRGGNKNLSFVKHTKLANHKLRCEQREVSSPFSVAASCDYYVIALRHIIR